MQIDSTPTAERAGRRVDPCDRARLRTHRSMVPCRPQGRFDYPMHIGARCQSVCSSPSAPSRSTERRPPGLRCIEARFEHLTSTWSILASRSPAEPDRQRVHAVRHLADANWSLDLDVTGGSVGAYCRVHGAAVASRRCDQATSESGLMASQNAAAISTSHPAAIAADTSALVPQTPPSRAVAQSSWVVAGARDVTLVPR